MVIVKTKTELAAVLNVRNGTVTDWSKRGMPRRSDGTYDTDMVAEWNRQRKANVSRGGRPRSADSDPDYWLAEKRKREVERLELGLQQQRGELVPRSWMDEQFSARALEIRRALQALARSLPPELAAGLPAEQGAPLARRIGARLAEEFQELCAHYSRALPEVPVPGQVPLEAGDDGADEEADAG